MWVCVDDMLTLLLDLMVSDCGREYQASPALNNIFDGKQIIADECLVVSASMDTPKVERRGFGIGSIEFVCTYPRMIGRLTPSWSPSGHGGSEELKYFRFRFGAMLCNTSMMQVLLLSMEIGFAKMGTFFR
jgi:hypothetical protein